MDDGRRYCWREGSGSSSLHTGRPGRAAGQVVDATRKIVTLGGSTCTCTATGECPPSHDPDQHFLNPLRHYGGRYGLSGSANLARLPPVIIERAVPAVVGFLIFPRSLLSRTVLEATTSVCCSRAGG